jgi:type II secretory pathway predicted ATPase ExeA
MTGHLHESRLALLELEGESRLHAINTPIFINHSQCDLVSKTMKRLMTLGPQDTYARGLLVWGCSDIGKTRFIQSLQTGEESWVSHLAFTDLKQDPNDSKFIVRLLTPLGLAEANFNKKNGMPLQRLADYLAARNTRALVIDEFQDFALATKAEMKRFLAILKTLSGAPCYLPIFIFGTETAYSAVAMEPMLAKRFKIMTILPWSEEDPEYLAFLDTCEQLLPLRKASGLSSPGLRRAIHIQTDGIPGKIVTLIRSAGCHAYASGEEQITMDMLLRASGENEYAY